VSRQVKTAQVPTALAAATLSKLKGWVPWGASASTDQGPESPLHTPVPPVRTAKPRPQGPVGGPAGSMAGGGAGAGGRSPAASPVMVALSPMATPTLGPAPVLGSDSDPLGGLSLQ
jgi:hypothetical protein